MRDEAPEPRGSHLVDALDPSHEPRWIPRGHRSLVDLVSSLEQLLPAPQPVGLAADPRDERLRFVHAASLGFHGDEVVAVELAGEPPVATVTTSLLGLCGVESPLPLYLLDDAGRDDDRGAALRGLLDVVHHRLISQLLRGLRERDVPATLRGDHADPWTERLLAFLGLRECPALPRPSLARLLPAWAAGVRSPAMLAVAIRRVLGEQLGDAEVRVDPCTGGWQPIDPDQHTRLGEPTAVLGDTAVLGVEVLHPAGGATVVVGPLPGDRARDFLPGGPAHARIAAVCRRFAAELSFELAAEMMSRPPPRLGERRLGEDLWLGDDPDAQLRHVVPLT